MFFHLTNKNRDNFKFTIAMSRIQLICPNENLCTKHKTRSFLHFTKGPFLFESAHLIIQIIKTGNKHKP